MDALGRYSGDDTGGRPMASKTATRPTTSDFEDEVTVDTIPMSYEEFLTWSEGDDGRRRGEWVDGEVIPFMPTADRHDRIIMFLGHVIAIYLDLRGPGRVFGQEFELRSRPGAAREPDMFVVLKRHLDRLGEMRLVGAADVVVEVISRDSVTRDRRVKHAEYEATGIPEYWLIDPREGRERIDLFRLGEDGRYRPVEASADGRVRSSVLPGVWLDRACLVEEELPGLVATGMAMAGVTYRVDPTL